MSFGDNLIMVGDYPIPMKYIAMQTYTATRTVYDLDSYRDANGKLHRTALEHTPIKIEFETPPLLSDDDVRTLFGSIQRNYIIPAERKAIVTAYVPEIGRNVTQDMYMPDPSTTIHSIVNGVTRYNPIRIAFIGY